MKRSMAWLVTLVLLAGCGIFEKQPSIRYMVYTYEQPFDLVYLRAIETLDTNDDWAFSYTDKETGVIALRNMNYENWFGMDRQYVRFVVRHVSQTETSVEIDPSASQCKGTACVQLLEKINTVLSALPPHPKEERPVDAEPSESAAPQPQPPPA